jgi:hypothetical protein
MAVGKPSRGVPEQPPGPPLSALGGGETQQSDCRLGRGGPEEDEP